MKISRFFVKTYKRLDHHLYFFPMTKVIRLCFHCFAFKLSSFDVLYSFRVKEYNSYIYQRVLRILGNCKKRIFHSLRNFHTALNFAVVQKQKCFFRTNRHSENYKLYHPESYFWFLIKWQIIEMCAQIKIIIN